MRTVVIVLMLALATGCSASRQSARSTTDCASDPSYTPPGQMNIAISDSHAGAQASNKTNVMAMPTPNKNQIQRHSIRAAAY